MAVSWLCSCLMLLKRGFKDEVLWASLFLGEEARVPLGSDTLESSAESLTSAPMLG